uniref:Uncharacterized protein n=1 Tax=Tanacetum cinerariifolium TaxID=118510 RepID=A0A699JYN2_TANCI|nr:hypothetical protein [Tanacetum cinerariifolium]
MSVKKVITKPVDYAALNQLSKDFESRFVPQTELSAEQAFWSQYSVNFKEPNLSSSTTIVEVPKELPKVSMVNSSLMKLKFHLASFDVVVKERTTATAITKGTWGFKHIKACFRDEIIPFVKALKESFNSFDQFLIDELTEVQNVFNQMEKPVEQHCVDKNKFQDKMEKPVEQHYDDKLYKFKEGDVKRLRIQDIEDMLLLLVQGKLTNLTVEERFVFNVSLQMFTRSIVIQRHVEDLQLGVESYQKKLNLTKPDTDRTLTDVRTALDDRLKGIRMQYLPQSIWRKSDKDRAAAMIQAIKKGLRPEGS